MVVFVALLQLLAACVVTCASVLPSQQERDPGFLENIAQVIGEPCPNGWEMYEDFCYLVNSVDRTWAQAQAYCRGLGGDLVKITRPDENEFVLELVKKKAPSLNQVWIGLKWDPTSQAFYWSDNSIPAEYSNWAVNEPNGGSKEPCGNMWIHSIHLPVRAAGTWNDFPCGIIPHHPLGLVCKKLRL